MADSVIKQRLQVNQDYVARFVCPRCGNNLTLDLSKGTRGTVELDMRCACEQRCKVMVSRRRHDRREVKLVGTYRSSTSDEQVPVQIILLSQSGLRFAYDDQHPIQVGDQGHVEFCLWDQGPQLSQQVVVRNVTDEGVGVEFLLTGAKDSAYQQYCDTVLSLYTLTVES